MEAAKCIRKRLNKKRYRANLFPRIVKRDIRRLYPRMLANVVNAGNAQLVGAFFATFARVDCLFSKESLRNDPSIDKPTFNNLEMFLLHFAIHCDLAPDVTVGLEHCKIHRYLCASEHKNNPKFSSEIVCDMVITGTKIYSYDRVTASPVALQIEDYLLHKRKTMASTSTNCEEVADEMALYPSTVYQGFVPSTVPALIAQQKYLSSYVPVTVTSRAVMRLTVDDDNCITGVFCVG
jgi:hypothetical protein